MVERGVVERGVVERGVVERGVESTTGHMSVYPLCGVHDRGSVCLPPVWSPQQGICLFTPCVESTTGHMSVYPLCGIFYFPWHRHQIEGKTSINKQQVDIVRTLVGAR